MRVEAELYRGRSVAWPIGAGAAAIALLVFLALQASVTAITYVAIATLLTLLSFIALTRNAPPGGGDRRRIIADARGLLVDDELLVPRQTILRARVTQGDERGVEDRVVIETHGLAPSHVLRVRSPRIAQALADTLQAAPPVAEFVALPPWAHRIRWLAIALTTSPWILFNVLRHLPGFTLFVIVGLYGLIALPMVVPQRICVGEDGVLLKWAGQRRFVPFGMIEEVRATALGIELDLVGDRTLEIRLGHRADIDAAQRAAMLARITDGIASHRRLASPDDEGMLSRRSRDHATWIDEMTVLGREHAGGYRAIAIPRERLWSVLENPTAEPSAREGAALALRESLDEEERTRLIAVAHKSASPRLRIAIDAVMTGGPEQIRIALEEAEIEHECEVELEHPACRARS